MKNSKIKPEKIIKPIQLLAAILLFTILVIGVFITAANSIKEPPWISPVLIIVSIIIVIIVLIMIYRMQTKYRPEMLSGDEYLRYTYNQNKFKNFHPANLGNNEFEKIDDSSLEEQRISEYQKNRGLFLTHIWRPSKIKDQVADIAIELYQHGQGPLSFNQVESVEYELGRKFFDKPVITKNKSNNFAIEVSAYAPMLCIAKVNLKEQKSIILTRYIDFDY